MIKTSDTSPYKQLHRLGVQTEVEAIHNPPQLQKIQGVLCLVGHTRDADVRMCCCGAQNRVLTHVRQRS